MKKTIINIIAITVVFAASKTEIISVKKLPENQKYTLTINSKKDVMGLQFDLKYNPDELKFNGAISLLDGFTFEYKDKGNGEVRGLLFSMSGEKLNMQDLSSLIEFDFEPAPNFIGDGKVEFTNLIVAGQNGESIDAALPSFTVSNENVLPVRTELKSVYPNPFNPVTTINYNIADEGMVNITIYDTLGRQVTELINEIRSAGQYQISWNAADVASGTYFVKLVTKDFVQSEKLQLVK